MFSAPRVMMCAWLAHNHLLEAAELPDANLGTLQNKRRESQFAVIYTNRSGEQLHGHCAYRAARDRSSVAAHDVELVSQAGQSKLEHLPH
jgi:hypothetical protein